MGDLSISQVSARPGRIGIRARQMFDGYRFQRGPVLVVVEDGRISAVDFAGSACPDMNLVDLGESTLLPGLVDAHAHLCWDPDGRPEDLAGDPHAVLVGRARRHAAAALRSGITTIRDLGDRDYAALALREEYRQKTTVGPGGIPALEGEGGAVAWHSVRRRGGLGICAAELRHHPRNTGSGDRGYRGRPARHHRLSQPVDSQRCGVLGQAEEDVGEADQEVQCHENQTQTD